MNLSVASRNNSAPSISSVRVISSVLLTNHRVTGTDRTLADGTLESMRGWPISIAPTGRDSTPSVRPTVVGSRAARQDDSSIDKKN